MKEIPLSVAMFLKTAKKQPDSTVSYAKKLSALDTVCWLFTAARQAA